ncbi:unnamed protein product, partial [marine sediment metagenome]
LLLSGNTTNWMGYGVRRALWSGFSNSATNLLAVIEKTANAEQVNGVGEEHWQMISELGESKEMLELAQEWQRVLALQEKMIELVQKAIESSDILYPCQFCRRLWQE